jgi:hypothetical protein
MSGHLTREEKDLWKREVVNYRLTTFEELKKWLKMNNIQFTSDIFGITLPTMKISNQLKVTFNGSKKSYQYNLEKIKEKILN